ncbi:MAG: glycosyltransferase family 39 protein [Candidatus Eremiobacteraeota bacterium]|nr:glycosyltransferase family 39 protein [Candidatus Eremiobacteraeota bacterium]
MTRAWVWALLLGVIAAIGIRFETRHDPQWAFDGYVYAIRAQMDAGAPYAVARDNARAAYRNTPGLTHREAQLSYHAAYPDWWTLFAPRVLYPWLASLLWPLAGFDSLFLVSNAAFAVSVVLLYLLFREFCPNGTAVLLAAALAFLPEYRLIGRSDVTDMTAFALWCAALYAMLRYARDGRRGALVAYGAATLLMCLTRPISYLPFFAACGLAAFGLSFKDRTLVARAAAMIFIAVLATLPPIFIGVASRAPGLVAQLAQDRAFSAVQYGSLAQWYWHHATGTFINAAVTFAISVFGPIAVAALVSSRARMESCLLLGALLATVPTILLDPLSFDVARVVVLPMIPVIGCGLALGLHFGKGAVIFAPGGRRTRSASPKVTYLETPPRRAS